MFQDMRVDHWRDCPMVRCNKVFNMINMIRNDVSVEREKIFDIETINIAKSLVKELEQLKKENKNK